MSSNIYRQADSRWGNLAYPSKPYTLGRSGCGCCSVTHCVIEQPKYCNFTPKDTRPFMTKYATRGNGTKWVGITEGLKHWGYKVSQPNVDKSMTPAWEILEDGKKHIGVILFRKGYHGKKKKLWTTSGHYVAFTDFRVKNGRHEFKMKDSGGRHNDGWFGYSDYMAGGIVHIWICERIEVPRKHEKGYEGTLPTTTLKKGDKGEEVKKLQKFLNFIYGDVLSVDGKFGNKTDSYVCQFQVWQKIGEDGIFGANSLKHAKALAKAKEYTK